jgi:exonuclease III
MATLPRFTLHAGAPREQHHPEGRVILLEFATLRLLFTYVPNSGRKGAWFMLRTKARAAHHATLLCRLVHPCFHDHI